MHMYACVCVLYMYMVRVCVVVYVWCVWYVCVCILVHLVVLGKSMTPCPTVLLGKLTGSATLSEQQKCKVSHYGDQKSESGLDQQSWLVLRAPRKRACSHYLFYSSVA